jgi:hypothetical protein
MPAGIHRLATRVDGLRPAAGIPGRRGEEALGLPSREIGMSREAIAK